ncbi:MAG: hypothetical protein ACI9U2_001625 [Bradymonadia bacterium]|jgi:hypothetical protein
MTKKLWRIPGLIVLWNLTVAAPNCGGTQDNARPLCGEVTCSTGQFCADESVCAPRLAVGERCHPRQCMHALRCDLGMASPKCVVPGAVNAGGECGARADCADALVCHLGTGCGPALPEGSDCSRSQSVCRAENRCREVPDDVDRCLPPAQEGNACTRIDECEDGLICSSGVGGGTCMVARAPGEHCQIHSDCGEGLFCADFGEADAQCAWAGEQGDACDPEALALCVDRLICDAGACRLAQEDEFCWKDEDCRADLECSPYEFEEDSYCIARPE